MANTNDVTLKELESAYKALNMLGKAEDAKALKAKIDEMSKGLPKAELDSEVNELVIRIPLDDATIKTWNVSKNGNPYVSINGLYSNDNFVLNGSLTYRLQSIMKKAGK